MFCDIYQDEKKKRIRVNISARYLSIEECFIPLEMVRSQLDTNPLQPKRSLTMWRCNLSSGIVVQFDNYFGEFCFRRKDKREVFLCRPSQSKLGGS